MQQPLLDAERRTLLGLARAAIAQRLRGDGSLDQALGSLEPSPGLERPSGVFVTLKIKSAPEGGARLRGCLGVLESSAPLYRSVIDTAPKTALEDPRFPPLTEEELDRVCISLSVLTPRRRIDNWEEIVVGRDGVELRHGGRRAVFLPQVATEQGWDRRRLLEQLSLKAGLRPQDWQAGQLSVFSAEVFSEEN